MVYRESLADKCIFLSFISQHLTNGLVFYIHFISRRLLLDLLLATTSPTYYSAIAKGQHLNELLSSNWKVAHAFHLYMPSSVTMQLQGRDLSWWFQEQHVHPS